MRVRVQESKRAQPPGCPQTFAICIHANSIATVDRLRVDSAQSSDLSALFLHSSLFCPLASLCPLMQTTTRYWTFNRSNHRNLKEPNPTYTDPVAKDIYLRLIIDLPLVKCTFQLYWLWSRKSCSDSKDVRPWDRIDFHRQIKHSTAGEMHYRNKAPHL